MEVAAVVSRPVARLSACGAGGAGWDKAKCQQCVVGDGLHEMTVQARGHGVAGVGEPDQVRVASKPDDAAFGDTIDLGAV